MKQPDSAPVLEITDGRGNLLPDATFRILATICHPDDPEQRQLCVDTLELKAHLDADDSVFQGLIGLVQTESVMLRLGDGAYGVSVAGDLLLLILSAATYSPKDASLARAIRAWCRDQARGRTYGGRHVPASERAVRSAWSRFRPVAHLCAALKINFDPQDLEKTTLLNDLPGFLAIAESYRVLGEKHHPPAGRTGSKPLAATTLDPLETWHVPSDLELPQIQAPIPQLTQFTLRVFSEYRAE